MWQMIGHEHAVRWLQQGLEQNRLSQAYLFAGPPQIGKRTLALQLAQAVNCQGSEPPCGACLSCQKIVRGAHPDVRVIQGEQGTLKIAQIRELQREASLSPYEGRWRVYVIRDFQQATTEAANALLKTLEEPPRQVMLILTTTEVGALLPTIVSRCQVFVLQPLPAAQVREALLARLVAPEQATLLAHLSEGRIGWAIQASQEKSILEERSERLMALRNLTRESIVQRMEYAQKASQKPETLPALLDLWVSWWRDLLLLQAGCDELVVNRDQLGPLRAEMAAHTLAEIERYIRRIHRAKFEIERNASPRLALEALVLECPRFPVEAARA